MLSTKTRLHLEALIKRLSKGQSVTLQQRLELHKYAKRFPMIAGKLKTALN